MEGFDEEERKYVGSKWGKYIRAPEIFFKIFEKGEEKFVLLSDISKVRYGLKTGAEEFFYLNEKQARSMKIEDKYLKSVFQSPRESKKISINPHDLSYKILNVGKNKNELKNTNVLKYIKLGEEKGFHERPSCRRARWYDLSHIKPWGIVLPRLYNERFVAFFNDKKVYIDDSFSEINPIEKDFSKALCTYLNSSLSIFISEICGSVALGQGALFLSSKDLKKLPVLAINSFPKNGIKSLERSFDKLVKRNIGTLFEEIGAKVPEKVKLDNVKKDRLELDNVIFDFLGLSKKEKLEVYRAIVDLIRWRIEKARSVKKKSKKSKVNSGIFADNILEETRLKELKKFPDEYIGSVETIEKELPEGNSVEVANDLFNGLHVKVDEEIVKCDSIEEAKYIKFAILNGQKTVSIPKRKEAMVRVVKEYDDLVTAIKTKADKILREEVKDKKLREKIDREIDRRIFRR